MLGWCFQASNRCWRGCEEGPTVVYHHPGWRTSSNKASNLKLCINPIRLIVFSGVGSTKESWWARSLSSRASLCCYTCRELSWGLLLQICSKSTMTPVLNIEVLSSFKSLMRHQRGRARSHTHFLSVNLFLHTSKNPCGWRWQTCRRQRNERPELWKSLPTSPNWDGDQAWTGCCRPVYSKCTSQITNPPQVQPQ